MYSSKFCSVYVMYNDLSNSWFWMLLLSTNFCFEPFPELNLVPNSWSLGRLILLLDLKKYIVFLSRLIVWRMIRLWPLPIPSTTLFPFEKHVTWNRGSPCSGQRHLPHYAIKRLVAKCTLGEGISSMLSSTRRRERGISFDVHQKKTIWEYNNPRRERLAYKESESVKLKLTISSKNLIKCQRNSRHKKAIQKIETPYATCYI